MAKREKDCGGYVGKALRNAQEREAANAKRRAKPEAVTDRKRAEDLVFEYAKAIHGDSEMVLGKKPTAKFRNVYMNAINLAMDAIALGRSLERAGGKPGKGKGGGK